MPKKTYLTSIPGQGMSVTAVLFRPMANRAPTPGHGPAGRARRGDRPEPRDRRGHPVCESALIAVGGCVAPRHVLDSRPLYF